MNISDFLSQSKIPFKERFDTSGLSSIRAGGTVKAFIQPRSVDELIYTVNGLVSMGGPYKLIGKCTNTLFSDGCESLCIVSTRGVRDVCFEDGLVCASAGAVFGAVQSSLKGSLKYLSLPMSGIPGTVGGMVRQNAGAFGECISDIFHSAEVYSIKNKRITHLNKGDMCFSYRNSILSSGDYILLRVMLHSKGADEQYIASGLDSYRKLRLAKQPTEPSLGSFFKRPPNDYSARLIDICGLRGMTVGGARVSEKHAGFIVNIGGATPKDIIDLSRAVKRTVYEKQGVLLEEEVEIIGN